MFVDSFFYSCTSTHIHISTSYCLTVACILSIFVSYINILLDLLHGPYGLCFLCTISFPLDNFLSSTGMYDNAFFFIRCLFDIKKNSK